MFHAKSGKTKIRNKEIWIGNLEPFPFDATYRKLYFFHISFQYFVKMFIVVEKQVKKAMGEKLFELFMVCVFLLHDFF